VGGAIRGSTISAQMEQMVTITEAVGTHMPAPADAGRQVRGQTHQSRGRVGIPHTRTCVYEPDRVERTHARQRTSGGTHMLCR
jgi:hypothetical protein